MTPTLLSLNPPSGKDRDVTREDMDSLSAHRKEEVRSCAEGRHGGSYPSLHWRDRSRVAITGSKLVRDSVCGSPS